MGCCSVVNQYKCYLKVQKEVEECEWSQMSAVSSGQTHLLHLLPPNPHSFIILPSKGLSQ